MSGGGINNRIAAYKGSEFERKIAVKKRPYLEYALKSLGNPYLKEQIADYIGVKDVKATHVEALGMFTLREMCEMLKKVA